MCGIFFIFCDSRFIKFFETVKSPKVKYLETLIFENSAHRFEDLIRTNKPEGFLFSKNFFQGHGAFFKSVKPLI